MESGLTASALAGTPAWPPSLAQAAGNHLVAAIESSHRYVIAMSFPYVTAGLAGFTGCLRSLAAGGPGLRTQSRKDSKAGEQKNAHQGNAKPVNPNPLPGSPQYRGPAVPGPGQYQGPDKYQAPEIRPQPSVPTASVYLSRSVRLIRGLSSSRSLQLRPRAQTRAQTQVRACPRSCADDHAAADAIFVAIFVGGDSDPAVAALGISPAWQSTEAIYWRVSRTCSMAPGGASRLRQPFQPFLYQPPMYFEIRVQCSNLVGASI